MKGKEFLTVFQALIFMIAFYPTVYTWDFYFTLNINKIINSCFLSFFN
ncbi:hypothetical protein KF201_2252 [Lactococcus lactis subsp. lactis]|nr:hypothetical protein KF201_2252 [Lactococcus lactis subsp. lactis]